MEREKMIEEIANIIRETTADYWESEESIAENICKAGYRKIPDGAVVLTKEELEKMDSRKNYGDVVDTLFFRIEVLKREHEKRLEQSRKETAREILGEIDHNIVMKRFYEGEYWFIPINFITALKQKYGVEVEE